MTNTPGRRYTMEIDNMTQAELIVWLETLTENIELKADTRREAAEIIRAKIESLQKAQN